MNVDEAPKRMPGLFCWTFSVSRKESATGAKSDIPTSSAMGSDEQFMQRALALAVRGWGWTNPNPLVGCVIVRDGEVIGQGWHTRFGALHAEREALADCRARGENPEGASAYVTLEPCCHTGKTPPCTEALIEARIARVIVGAPDPNPLVAGKGTAQLRAAGITVDEGVLLEECKRINRPFFHFIESKTPYVTLKFAMTLDGKVATRTGASRWITGDAARAIVHLDRARASAVMVGVGTVLADDPMLTCRLTSDDALRYGDAFAQRLPQGATIADAGLCGAFHQPTRMVCDTHLRTPLTSQIVTTARDVSTMLLTCEECESAALPYREAGCEVVVMPEKEGHIDLAAAFDLAAERGMNDVMVEAGPALAASLMATGRVRRVQAYVAPKLFGGQDAPSPLGGSGVETPDEAWHVASLETYAFGNDVLLEGEVA